MRANARVLTNGYVGANDTVRPDRGCVGNGCTRVNNRRGVNQDLNSEGAHIISAEATTLPSTSA